MHSPEPPRRPQIVMVTKQVYTTWRDVPEEMKAFDKPVDDDTKAALRAPSGAAVLRVVKINEHKHLITSEYARYDKYSAPIPGQRMPSMFD